MNLPIEQWANEKRFSEKVNKLIHESVICYKHGAFRASLLFSYLAFITFLKETIIQSKKPDLIPQGRWNNIQNELQDDDKWEKRVFDELSNSSSPLFNIKEDIRQQIKYWKDRRNDCAHFKSNEIESHHVESFWSFLKSNLSKITIEGGKANLIKKFVDHFDSTKTPPNTDFTHLVKEIENAVELNEFPDFISELENKLDPIGFFDKDLQMVYNKILEICPTQYTELFVKKLKESNTDIELIASFPDKINLMNYSKTEIRELWKKRVIHKHYDRFMFEIYAALLRNNLIPSNQKKEALETLFDKYEQTRHNIPTDTTVKSAIATPEFGEIIYSKVFEDNRLSSFMWINSKCDLIAFYIENYSVKKSVVQKICEMFDYPNYSWWLRDAINRVFENNIQIKTKFHEIATKNGYKIPVDFQ